MIQKNVMIMTDYKERPREAALLSMAGGLIIATVGLSWIILMAIGWATNWFDWLDTFMHGFDNHFHFLGIGSFGYVMGFSGLVLGIGIMLASLMLNRGPDEHGLWGIVIIILSALSMMGGMGGMGLGLLLGVVGGILAVLWQPPKQVQTGSHYQ